MTSPGGRIEIRVDPDLRGFGNRLSSGLTDSARTGVAAFAAAAKTALIGAAVGIGAAGIVAAKSTLDIGREYEGQLNTLQAVSSATEAQMQSIGRTAKTLGSDLTLPATSAADAAAVMTELAKASFTVDEAQQAAKGSLQLAAAAQIEGAQAATIQANAINAYGLAATDATRVADVLANAANASSAEITDVADSLAQASAVAASANISIEDTATAIGILANNGIRGSDAGTLLKSALLALQSPSKQARDAMGDLGLTAYDAQGNFVGLRSIFEQVAAAQGTMSQEAFEAATSTLFGSDAARLAGIAAREGAGGWDAMAAAMGREGAAAEVAEAKSRGLGGAIEAFKSQVETVQIDIYERAAPSLERLVRAAAERLPEVAASALDTADDVVASFQEMAPRIGRALDARRDTVVAAWKQLGQPLVDGARDLAEKGLDVAVDAAERLGELAGDAIDTVEPLADSIGDLATSLAETNGPLDAVGGGLHVLADGAGLALDILGPFVGLASNLVGVVTDLPGPLQTAVLGFAAFRLFGGRAGDWATSGFTGKIINPFLQFGQTVRMQMALADDSITRSAAFRGGLASALERQAPSIAGAWAQISGAYRGGVAEASQAWTKHGLEVDGFATRVQGLGRAAQTAGSVGIAGLRSAAGGLVAFMGGPWGVALAGAGLGIGFITSAMAKHEQQVKDTTAQLLTWRQELDQGGSKSSEAAKKLAEFQDKVAAAEKALRGAEEANKAGALGGAEYAVGVDIQRKKIDELKKSLADSRREYEQQKAAMSPVEIASAAVTAATNNLNMALKNNPPNSEAVRSASERLRTKQAELAGAQNTANDAVKTSLQLLQDQANKQLASVSSALAAQQAQLSLKTAVEEYKTQVASGALAGDQLAAAQVQIAQNAISTAQALGLAAADQAKSNGVTDTATISQQAQLASLRQVAEQLGTATPQAVTDAIAALERSAGTAATTAATFDALGSSVRTVPGSKDVIVNAPTEDQRTRLEGLGLTVTNIPGTKNVTVHANTAEAQEALDAFVAQRRVMSINVRATMPDLPGEGSTSQRMGTYASGGYIRGPGTGTSDSIPIWASNGEYMIRAAVTARSRPGLDAANRGDWAAAARVFSRLADQQSRASISAMAGSRAAAAAGRYAAGGYITAQERAGVPGVVTVPQRVTNIQNTLNAAPGLPTIDQLQRMQRKAEVLAGVR